MMQVTYKDAKKVKTVPIILFGSIAITAGFGIYLYLPLAFLEMNLTMILKVFFAILMGMLFGITLIVSNL